MRAIRVFAALCLFAGSVACPAQENDYLIPDATVPTASQHTFEQGRDFEKRRQLSAAVDSYNAALKASGASNCDACLAALYRTQMKMEEFKDAAHTTTLMVKSAPNDAARAEAAYREGEAWYQLYFALLNGRAQYDKNPKKAQGALASAASAMDRAHAADPASEHIRMMRAHVLASMNKDQDAAAEFTGCSTMPGISDQECTRAQRFAKDVSIARNEAAPNFKLKTLDGQPVSLDSLAGKVVLIDFWATWCPVCRHDSDYVQTMADMFDKTKFVLLEISGDSNGGQWKNYVADNRLEGVHARDADGSVSEAFHVTGFPTYVILDGDGVVRLRTVGIDGDLKGTVKKLLSEQKASTPATPHEQVCRALILARVSSCAFPARCLASNLRDRPTKQVRRTTQVEPIFIEPRIGS